MVKGELHMERGGMGKEVCSSVLLEPRMSQYPLRHSGSVLLAEDSQPCRDSVALRR